jgi:hypothetical protein
VGKLNVAKDLFCDDKPSERLLLAARINRQTCAVAVPTIKIRQVSARGDQYLVRQLPGMSTITG